MERRSESTMQPQPLSCPRCGCPETKIIKSQRMNQAVAPEPLPALRRTRRCDRCQKQFRTKEQIEEVNLQSSVWKVTLLDEEGYRRQIDMTILTEGRWDGEWLGEWTGYEVHCEFDGQQYTLHTRNEMRTEAYPCLVIIGNFAIKVISKKASDE